MAKSGKARTYLKLFKEHIKGSDIANTGALLAYFMLLSFFPLMLALGNLLPLFNIDPSDIMPYLDELAPDEIGAFMHPIIEQLLTSGNGGLLTIGMLGVTWAASNGVIQLNRGFGLAYGVVDKRNNFIKMIVSVVAVVLVLLLIIALVIIFGLGTRLFEALASSIPDASQIGSTLSGLRWPVTFVVLLLILLCLYVGAPSVKVRVRDALPGALLSAVGWMLLVVTFTLLSELIAPLFIAYGVLSTFFVLTFWLNFAGMLVLFGAVLNAVIYEQKHGDFELKEYPISQRINHRLKKMKLPIKID